MNHKIAFNFSDGRTLFLSARHNELLLDAAFRNGIKLPVDCREGVCGTCMGRCDTGEFSMDYADEDTLSPADLAQRKVLSCQTRVLSDAAFSFAFDSSLCHSATAEPCTASVTAVEQLSATTARLELTLHQERQLDFLPGQYARLHVPGTGVHRAYSFACRPNAENRLQFLIRLLPQGVMSDYIRQRCKVGDMLQLEGPLGTFYRRQIERPVMLIAGGTGLSAFLGMLDEMAEHNGCGQPVLLYHGARQPADLCEQQRIEHYQRNIPGFAYRAVISDEARWPGLKGFVTDHLAADADSLESFDTYLCGPPPMVDAVRDWLQDNQRAAQPLYYEKFTEATA